MISVMPAVPVKYSSDIITPYITTGIINDNEN